MARQPKPVDLNHGNAKLTTSLLDQLCKHLEEGNMRRTACHIVGIHYNTLHRWIKQGDNEGSGPFYDLAVRVRAAEAKAEHNAVQRIYQTNPTWWLSRRWKQDWSERTEITGSDGSPIAINVILPPEEDDGDDRLPPVG